MSCCNALAISQLLIDIFTIVSVEGRDVKRLIHTAYYGKGF